MTQPIGPSTAPDPALRGPGDFARLPRLDQVEHAPTSPSSGVPFDTGVSYRPGARFGRDAIREASRLLRPYNPALDASPFALAQVADAGDIAVNPFNIDEADRDDRGRRATTCSATGTRLVTLGGDHTIALPLLRAVAKQARPGRAAALRRAPGHLGHLLRRRVHPRHAVPPRRRGGHPRHRGALPRRHPRPAVRQEGPRGRPPFGFGIVTSADVYRQGVDEVVDKLRQRIGDRPLYISIDIDVLDPAHAPGTGTPEAGGMTSRELLEILRGLPRPATSSAPTSSRSPRPTTTPRSPASPPPTSPTT